MYVRDINNLFCNFSLEQHYTVDYQIKFEHKGSECDVIYATIQYIVYTHYCTHYTVRTHAGVHCIFMFCIVNDMKEEKTCIIPSII